MSFFHQNMFFRDPFKEFAIKSVTKLKASKNCLVNVNYDKINCTHDVLPKEGPIDSVFISH